MWCLRPEGGGGGARPRAALSAAEALLLAAHSRLEAALGPTHGRTLETAGRLAELYKAWGRKNEAELWRNRAR